MNKERLEVLIDYLNILSKLDGSYHNEIRIATNAIEVELGIKTKTIREAVLAN